MSSPLIDAATLAALLAAGSPTVVLDVRWFLGAPDRGRAEYEAGHIPGARFVAENDFAAPPGEGGRHPLPSAADFQASVRRLGLRPGTPVVLTDQNAPLAAARMWWLLTDAGFTDVRVLDGGMDAWLAAGGELTTVVPSWQPSGTSLTTGRRGRVDADQVAGALRSGGTVVDVRAANRYRGEDETVDPVPGHIPGAISMPIAQVQDADGRFLAPERVAEALSPGGEDPIYSCGSGITACQAILAREVAGVGGGRIFPGSWSGWITDPTRPVATGPESGVMP